MSDDEITDVHDGAVTGVSDEVATDVVVAPLSPVAGSAAPPVRAAPPARVAPAPRVASARVAPAPPVAPAARVAPAPPVAPAARVAPATPAAPAPPSSPPPSPTASQRSEEDGAFESLMSVLLNSPDLDRVLLQSFEALAERTGRWHDLAATGEDLAARLEEHDPASASHVWLRVAQVHQKRLDDTASALIAAEQAGRLGPSAPEPLALRAELHRVRGEVVERAAVLAQLAQLYEVRQDWQALLETYEQGLELAAGEEQRFAIVRAIAELVSSGRATPSPESGLTSRRAATEGDARAGQPDVWLTRRATRRAIDPPRQAIARLTTTALSTLVRRGRRVSTPAPAR